MITEATVRKTHLYPEMLPDARFVSVAAGFEASPSLLDLRRFEPRVLQLVRVAADRSADAELRIRADNLKRDVNCGGLFSLEPNSWDVLGTNFLTLNVYAKNPITDFRSHFGLWVYEPTVAHKIKYGMRLTDEDKTIDQELNVAQSVEKGVLPLPISYMIEREYQVANELTYTSVADVDTEEATIFTVTPERGQFIVLTGIAANPGTTAQNIRLRIDRDTDADYLELSAYPMSLDKDVACFIPALSEIRVKAVANSAVADHVFRITVKHCIMTNAVRVRFGLLSRAEVPGDLWNKVKGGVL